MDLHEEVAVLVLVLLLYNTMADEEERGGALGRRDCGGLTVKGKNLDHVFVGFSCTSYDAVIYWSLQVVVVTAHQYK